MERWCAVAPPGLEAVVARELATLGVETVIEPGLVRFFATREAGAQLAYRLRTPARLLVELATAPARTSPQLTALIGQIDWAGWLPGGVEVVVEASAKGSHLCREDAVVASVTAALTPRLRALLPGRRPPQAVQRVAIRLVSNVATVSLDAGGAELLHIRGWRAAQGKAPLRENLAAAVLIAGGYAGDEALVDPFCGAGTLAIEAALMADGRGPFVGRRLACGDWLGVGRGPKGTPPSAQRPPIVAADRDGKAVAMALENAERAGVALDLRCVDVSALEPPAPTGLVVANPPYGHRLGQQVDGVYVAFGRALRERFTGWRVAFLAPDERLAQKVDSRAQRLTVFPNGGLRVGLYALSI